MISFINVTKSFDSLKVLNDLSFNIKKNEIAVFLGPSGAGKTTILRLIAGILKSDSGKISLESDKIGFVFQDHRLLPWQTAGNNISLVLEAYGMEKINARKNAQEWLDRLGLKSFENYYPSQLSGGMVQRISLARAFAIQPQIMLMDEPFSSLDREQADSLQKDLKAVLAEYQTTTVYVTHDLVEALNIGDRIFKLVNGRFEELSITSRKAMLQNYIDSRLKGK